MEAIWYGVITILLGTYVLLDGYDLGAGIAYILYANNDEEKEKVVKSIRSVWDANEIWLLAFLVINYVVFPKYFTIFSTHFGGFFLLFFIFLLIKTLFFNLLSVFKNKPILKNWTGYFFGLLNFVLAIFISLIFANILRGVFLYDKSQSLHFVSKHFSPFSDYVGLFDWFTVIVSVLTFVGIMIHGLVWVILKNSGAYTRKLKKIVQSLALLELILIIAFLISWYFLHPDIFDNYLTMPLLFIFPVLAFVSLFGLIGVRTYQGNNKGFILSTNLIIFSWISIVVAMFPRFIMSLNEQKLTAYNVDFDKPDRYYFEWWVFIIAIFLLVYSIIIHKYSKGNDLS
jgi:cytochrome d ubiquinol oxidase subunit II